jgi:hypothetical protein
VETEETEDEDEENGAGKDRLWERFFEDGEPAPWRCPTAARALLSRDFILLRAS